jgi:hypothetical protein
MSLELTSARRYDCWSALATGIAHGSLPASARPLAFGHEFEPSLANKWFSQFGDIIKTIWKIISDLIVDPNVCRTHIRRKLRQDDRNIYGVPVSGITEPATTASGKEAKNREEHLR